MYLYFLLYSGCDVGGASFFPSKKEKSGLDNISSQGSLLEAHIDVTHWW